MADPKQVRLLERLVELTRNGELEWRETPQENTFEVSFPNYSLLLSAAPSEQDFETDDYFIRIVNSKGETVDTFSDVELTASMNITPDAPFKPYFAMQEIYETARRVARGADKALDEILSVLDKMQP